MDANTITERLKGLGWKLIEVPIRSGNEIKRWKVIASKGDKSYETTEATREDSLNRIGQVLGVIPRDQN